MNWRTLIAAIMVFCLVMPGIGIHEGYGAQAASTPPDPDPAIAGIQAGIERHIEEQVRLGRGYFELPFETRNSV